MEPPSWISLIMPPFWAVLAFLFQVLTFDDDEHWYSAEQEGKSGMVPANYLDIKPHE